jgi:hypothetical protein
VNLIRKNGEMLLSKWPNFNEEIALGSLLNGNKDTELKNLGTLTNKIKYNWGRPAEDNVTEARLRIKPGWVTECTDREPS